MPLELDEIGSILSWHTKCGTVIPERRLVNGKLRGGSHVCLPVQGTVPEKQPIWDGVYLEQHGLLRKGRDLFVGEEEKGEGRIFRFAHQPTAGYPWQFAAEIEFRTGFDGGRDALTYGLTVTRDKHCENKRPMPFSGGLHPYLAVQEDDFELYIGSDKVVGRGECEINSPKFFPLSDGWPTIHFYTGNLHLTMITRGADELVLWRPSPDQVCFEPVFARRTGSILECGESHQILAGMFVEEV